MPDRESRRGGRRERVKAARSRAVAVASLVVLAWAMNDWAVNEPGAPAIDDAPPAQIPPIGPAVAFAGTPHAALALGDLGVAALLAQAFSREPMALQAARWSGGGRTAEDFRDLYEGEPGEAARFVFARHTPGRSAP